MDQQKQLDRDLVSAAYQGNIDTLKELISKGGNLNAKGYNGEPLLLCAAGRNKVEVVRYLLNDVHVPIEVCDKRGCTPLLTAASCGALDVVQFLVSAGANILARNALDETALHMSARTESVETFKFLQQSGVPIDALDIRGRTVLHHAAEFAYPKMVEYILDGGWVSVDCLDKNGETPLMLTADFPRNERDPVIHSSWFSWEDGYVNKVIKLLLNAGADLSIKDLLDRDALHRSLGNRDNFTFLLEKCKNFIHSVDKKGQTPILRLFTAFRHSWHMHDVASLLLEAGADVKSCDSEGRTPLYIATEKRCFYEVQALIKSGAETSSLEKVSLTKILHIAVWNKNLELAKRMLAEGADINGRQISNRDSPSTEKDHTVRCLGCYGAGGHVYYALSGESPLFQAVIRSVKILKLLIDAGADVNFKDDHGCTPLQTAVDNICYEALEMLLNAGADPNIVDDCGVSPLHSTSHKHVKLKGITKFTERLLQAGANVNVADHKGRTPIHHAANKGHWKNLAILLKAGANVNVVDVNGASALLISDKHHYTQMIKLLVDAGANVNLKDDHGCSPLRKAVDNGDFEAMEILLDAGADPNTVDEYGVSPLHTISSRPVDVKDTLKFMERLLQAGANVNVADHNGITPLHCAAKAGNCKAARLLLDAGANLTTGDKNGQQIIHKFSEIGDTTAIDYFMEKWPSTWGCDSNGNTVLHFATRSGKNRLVCMDHILRNNLVSIDDRNIDGQTALAILVEYGSKKHSVQPEVEMMLEKGASPSMKDNKGKTPLHTASSVDDVKVMEALIVAGADVTLKDATGRTPLHWAAKVQSVEGLELLLQNTTNIDEQDNNGQTPLMLTVGSSATVSLLLRKGANVNLKDHSGKTALEEAMDLGCHGAVKLLWAAVSNLTDVSQESCIKAVHLAIKAGDAEMLDHLISLGISLSHCWRDLDHGTTLLHCAAQSSVEMLKRVIDSGHTESAHDHAGCTPLHLAVQSLNFEGAKCLLKDAHVPVNDRDVNGRTALMLAVSSGWNYSDVFDMLEILVDSGADITAQDKDGKTAYQLAFYAWADMTHDVLDYMQYRQ